MSTLTELLYICMALPAVQPVALAINAEVLIFVSVIIIIIITIVPKGILRRLVSLAGWHLQLQDVQDHKLCWHVGPRAGFGKQKEYVACRKNVAASRFMNSLPKRHTVPLIGKILKINLHLILHATLILN